MIVDKLQWFCALRVVLQSVLVHPRKRLRCSLYYAAAGKVFNSPVASRYIHRRLIILLLLTACSCIYKPNPNFQIPSFRSERGYRPGSQAQTSHASPETQTTALRVFLSLFALLAPCQVLCVWSSQPPTLTLPIQTKFTLPDT